MKRILLIDDQRDGEFLTKKYQPCQVFTAKSFDKGIEKLKDGGWDVLMLDHDLEDPDINKDGYRIACFLEQNQHLLPTTVELVTANAPGRERMAAVFGKIYPHQVGIIFFSKEKIR